MKKTRPTADATQAYINQPRKAAHTRQLRESYAASAADSRAVAGEWEGLSDEAWARLDEAEK